MNKTRAQVTEGIVSVITNTVLFILKFWAGISTGSIAIVADAWHTLSDSFTSIFVIFSAMISSKKADKEHPFGHGRWEHISSIFVAFALGIVAYEFLKNSIMKLSNHETANYGRLAIIATIISIIAKELLAQYAFFIAKKTGNAIVKADGWHHRSDALSSVIVLAGILLGMKFKDQLWWVDGILGILVALMIFYATFEIMKEAITKILGEVPGQELTEKINSEIRKIYTDDLNMHHLHLHNYVLHRELTMHIRLNKNLSIKEGHKTATVIEDLIKEKFDTDATVHVEPLE